jgi:hypothetical protein
LEFISSRKLGQSKTINTSDSDQNMPSFKEKVSASLNHFTFFWVFLMSEIIFMVFPFLRKAPASSFTFLPPDQKQIILTAPEEPEPSRKKDTPFSMANNPRLPGTRSLQLKNKEEGQGTPRRLKVVKSKPIGVVPEQKTLRKQKGLNAVFLPFSDAKLLEYNHTNAEYVRMNWESNKEMLYHPSARVGKLASKLTGSGESVKKTLKAFGFQPTSLPTVFEMVAY